VMTWVFAASYFAEHISVIAGLAHHTKIVAGALATAVLVLVIKSAGPTLRRAGRALWRRARVSRQFDRHASLICGGMRVLVE